MDLKTTSQGLDSPNLKKKPPKMKDLGHRYPKTNVFSG